MLENEHKNVVLLKKNNQWPKNQAYKLNVNAGTFSIATVVMERHYLTNCNIFTNFEIYFLK